MGNNVEKEMSGGQVFLDYSQAALEYTGLLTYSYIKRGGMLAIDPLAKIAAPLVEKLGPVAEKVGPVLGRTVQGFLSGVTRVSVRGVESARTLERLASIEKRLSALEGSLSVLDKIEKRLDYIEKHGIIASAEGGLQVKGKKLTEDRLMLLKIIVSENIDLVEGGA